MYKKSAHSDVCGMGMRDICEGYTKNPITNAIADTIVVTKINRPTLLSPDMEYSLLNNLLPSDSFPYNMIQPLFLIVDRLARYASYHRGLAVNMPGKREAVFSDFLRECGLLVMEPAANEKMFWRGKGRIVQML